MIRKLQTSDWEQVKSIYIEGIKTNNATFERVESINGFEEWFQSRIKDSCHVLEMDDDIMGWCSLSLISDRCVYQGVAEVSVYVASTAQGRGVGKSLLNILIDYAESNGIWTLQARIFPENQPSMAIHKKAGFRTVGYREKIGKIAGEWRDLMLFERRSTLIL